MEKNKIKLEIYEGDPFGSTCCGPGPQITSIEAAEKFRQMLTQRNQTVEKLSTEFRDIVEVEREILSQKRYDYPEHVRKLMFEDKPLPYIFINGEAVLTGKFPTYEEFVTLLKPHLKPWSSEDRCVEAFIEVAGNTEVVHVHKWKEFKKLAIISHPQFIAYSVQNAPLSRPPVGLRLVFSTERIQYVFLDFAHGNTFTRTKLPLYINDNGIAYFKEEDLKDFIYSELNRRDISIVSFEILGYWKERPRSELEDPECASLMRKPGKLEPRWKKEHWN